MNFEDVFCAAHLRRRGDDIEKRLICADNMRDGSKICRCFFVQLIGDILDN